MIGFIYRCMKVSRIRFGYVLLNVTQYKSNIKGYFVFTQKYTDNMYLENRNKKIFCTNSTTGPTYENVQNEIALLTHNAHLGRIQYDHLNKILKYLENNHVNLSDDTSLLLLNCCGNMLPDLTLESRQQLTQRVWNLIYKKGCELSLKYYHALLKAYAENSHSIDPYKFLKAMPVQPDANTYIHLLHTVAKTGNIQLMYDIISRMQEQKYLLFEDAYEALVEAYVVQGNIKGATETIKLMEEKGLKPSLKAIALIACGYARDGDISNLMILLEDNKMDIRGYMEIIKALSFSGNGEHIPNVVNTFTDSIDNNESVVVNTIIELAYKHKFTDAYNIINSIPCIQEDNVTMTFLADYLLELMIEMDRPYSEIMEIVNKFVESKKYPDALLKVAEIAVYKGKVNLALKIFEEMGNESIPLRPHYYWPLFISGFKNEGESAVWSLIAHMALLNVRIDHDTLCCYILPHINTAEPFVTFKKLRDCVELKSIPTQEILTALISFLLNRGRIDECILLRNKLKGNINYNEVINYLLEVYDKTRDIDKCLLLLNKGHKSTHFIETFLRDLTWSYSITTNLKDVRHIINAIQKHNISISSGVVHNLKKKIHTLNYNIDESEEVLELLNKLITQNTKVRTGGLQTFKLLKSDESLMLENEKITVYPRELSIEQLTNNLMELKHKNLNTRGTLRKLLLAHCRQNNLEEVKNILTEIDSVPSAWTPGMKAALFDFYVRHAMLNEASEQLDQLMTQHGNFKIDDFKIISYATTLIKHDKVRDAFSVIQKYDCNQTEKSRVSMNCWELLNTMANSKYFRETKKMLEVLTKKGYCKINNKLLGPLVKCHLLQNNIRAAVDTFQDCVMKYGMTPMKQELLTVLVKNYTTYPDELHQILKSIESIHGKNEAILGLILSLADCKHIEHLQNALKKSDLTASLILNGLQYYPVDKKLSILLTILDSGENLPDIHLLYEELLLIYNKYGDYKNAILLWKKMAEIMKPTKEFLKVLINLLIFNKIPLPPELKLSEHQLKMFTEKNNLRLHD